MNLNLNVVAIQLGGPVAVAVGLLSCFLGYRLVKLTLALIGFIAGVGGGWTAGLALAPNNDVIALACALVVGVLCAILCVWLFFLGIFILGASAGAVIAAAALNAAGHPAQPVPVLVLAAIFGVIALLLQKFMIIVSTAFSGSYLVTAALVHLLTGVQKAPPLWFAPTSGNSANALGYVALGAWLLLGLAGTSFQYRRSRSREKNVRQEPPK